MIEDESFVLVFDYPDFDVLSHVGLFSQEIEIRPYLAPKKKVFFFSSHSHPDHFNPKVLTLVKELPDSRFIFSYEVLNIFPDFSRDMEDRCSALMPADSIAIDETKIHALPSTDIGVSFFIEHNGTNIFFPGDLALWLWEDLKEQTRDYIEKTFKDTIMDVKERKPDILFVVVEPNLKDLGWGGAVYAVKNLMPSLIVPIHLGRQYSVIYEFKKTLPEGSEVFSYRRAGDYYDWEKQQDPRQ